MGVAITCLFLLRGVDNKFRGTYAELIPIFFVGTYYEGSWFVFLLSTFLPRVVYPLSLTSPYTFPCNRPHWKHHVVTMLCFFWSGIFLMVFLLVLDSASCILGSHPSLLLSSFIGWCISWSVGSSKQVYQHKRNTYHNVSPILDHRDPKQCADSPI